MPSKIYSNKKINLKNDKQLINVLQLSDLHYDFEYLADSVANCNNPICCQKNSITNFNQTKQFAGYWGTASNCDIPFRTIINMLQHINKTHKAIIN